jgi:hypothetical protein
MSTHAKAKRYVLAADLHYPVQGRAAWSAVMGYLRRNPGSNYGSDLGVRARPPL